MIPNSKVTVLVATAALGATLASAQNKPTFRVENLPKTWEQGQVGSNQCEQWGASSQSSMCQNIFINSVNDFCLWAPFKGQGTVGAQEERMVSYCLKSGYGTRLIPSGALHKAHFVKTPDFVQVTGYGDFTGMHIQGGDSGGELDPHGATGTGNPPGGLVFSRSVPGKNGQWVQLKEWSNFQSATEFSFRACYPGGSNAKKYCPHVYDVMGSQWNHPGNYGEGFSNCDADSGSFPGIHSASTFRQGDQKTPTAHKAPKSSNCKAFGTVKGGMAKHTPYRRELSVAKDHA